MFFGAGFCLKLQISILMAPFTRCIKQAFGDIRLLVESHQTTQSELLLEK